MLGRWVLQQQLSPADISPSLPPAHVSGFYVHIVVYFLGCKLTLSAIFCQGQRADGSKTWGIWRSRV